MVRDIVPLMRNPATGAGLELKITREDGIDIIEGELRDVQMGETFPIENGIACLLPPAKAEPEVSDLFPSLRSWEYGVERLDASFWSKLMFPIEVSALRDALELQPEDWMIEVGAGKGRLMERFGGIPHRAVGVDVSLSNLSVGQLRVKKLGFHYVSWIQAHPLRLPFQDDCFDKVLCARLLHHITNPVNREQCLKELARVCKPTGRIAVCAFAFDLFAKLRKDKTGVSVAGLPYVRFTKEEFLSLLHKGMLVDEVTQQLQYLWTGYGVPIKQHSVIVS
ncbi:MAG: methyltransferase domain-containing protein [Fimbriimonadales bacterium]|nr:methyltransferase domain-containing protein [Fimbriimonadales bacterium]